MEFCLLGPLTVRHGDRLVDIPQGKPRAVLAVLLTRSGQVVPADELIDLIWDGSAPPSARATMHNHVKRLRRALGPAGEARITTCRPGYRTETGPDELDLTRFGALCDRGRKSAARGDWEYASFLLRAGLSLWRGRPLLDIQCPLLTVSEVPRLEEIRASALEALFTADLHLGRHHELIGDLQQFVATERLRERAHELLMLALYRAGRRADALAAYQAARRELVRELGLEPGAELRSLHERILTADPRLDLAQPLAVQRPVLRAVPRQLPPTVPVLAGRRAEWQALTKFLSLRGSRPRFGETAGIFVIHAGAGMGKTALAVHWARQAACEFPDGQLYVDLCGFGADVPLDPAQAVRGFLSALGVTAAHMPPDGPTRAALYRSLLASRQMLVLLDNARSASQVRPLLPAGPGCLVVVTSRDRLTELAATEGARHLTLAPLSAPDAQELLAHRLGAQQMASEPAAIADLIRLCAGSPRALAEAAARITSLPGIRVAAVTRTFAASAGPIGATETGSPATSTRLVAARGDTGRPPLLPACSSGEEPAVAASAVQPFLPSATV